MVSRLCIITAPNENSRREYARALLQDRRMKAETAGEPRVGLVRTDPSSHGPGEHEGMRPLIS